MIDAQRGLDAVCRVFTPMNDGRWEKSAEDKEDDAGGKWPAFAWKGIGDVDDVLWQHAEEEDAEEAHQIDGVEGGGEGQAKSDPWMIFQCTVEQKVFGAVAECSRQSDERETADEEKSGEARGFGGEAEVAGGVFDVTDTDFESADNADEAGRSGGNDKPVNESTGDALRIRSSKPDENEAGLAEAKVGEESAWFFLNQSTHAGEERGEKCD